MNTCIWFVELDQDQLIKAYENILPPLLGETNTETFGRRMSHPGVLHRLRQLDQVS